MWDFLLNVCANFVALVLTLVGAWFCHVTFGRRALLKFFGIGEEKILKIYVGHIPHPNIPKGLVGFEEISEAKNLEALFKSLIPGLGDQPGLFKFLQVADLKTEIIPGVSHAVNVTLDHSLVSIGAPTSNFASCLLESELKNPVKCDMRNGNITVPNLSPITDTQAVVVRICKKGKNYFYIAGKYEPATAGGTRFLIQNWKSMHAKYGNTTSFFYLVETKEQNKEAPLSVANNELHIPG